MVGLLLLLTVAAGPPDGAPSSASRLFDIRSRQAWELVQKRLRDLGLSSEKTDRASQVVRTRWHAFGDVKWLPPPPMPPLYAARRVRFAVFVSPYAEPARVYVGSLIEATQKVTAPATGYNAPTLNEALMGEIAKAIGHEGRPIPVDGEKRRQLALSVLGDEADDCLRNGWPRSGKVTPPRKIPISEFEVIYPGPALKDRIGGEVEVEFTILEDGAVTGMRLLGPPLGGQLEASAMGAASLLLYTPARRDECNVPSIMTYKVRFRR